MLTDTQIKYWHAGTFVVSQFVADVYDSKHNLLLPHHSVFCTRAHRQNGDETIYRDDDALSIGHIEDDMVIHKYKLMRYPSSYFYFAVPDLFLVLSVILPKSISTSFRYENVCKEFITCEKEEGTLL